MIFYHFVKNNKMVYLTTEKLSSWVFPFWKEPLKQNGNVVVEPTGTFPIGSVCKRQC